MIYTTVAQPASLQRYFTDDSKVPDLQKMMKTAACGVANHILRAKKLVY